MASSKLMLFKYFCDSEENVPAYLESDKTLAPISASCSIVLELDLLDLVDISWIAVYSAGLSEACIGFFAMLFY